MAPLNNAFTEVSFIMDKKMLMMTLILLRIIGIGHGIHIILYVMAKGMARLSKRHQIKLQRLILDLVVGTVTVNAFANLNLI